MFPFTPWAIGTGQSQMSFKSSIIRFISSKTSQTITYGNTSANTDSLITNPVELQKKL